MLVGVGTALNIDVFSPWLRKNPRFIQRVLMMLISDRSYNITIIAIHIPLRPG